MKTFEQILSSLKAHSRPDQLAGMKRFGMSVDNRLGLSMPFLRKMAKTMSWR